MMINVRPYLRVAGRMILDRLFPPCCPACGVHVARHGTLCPNCWGELHFITRPFCSVMGTPFPYEMGAGLVSGEALRDPPPFHAARSVVIHEGIARRLVTRLKYGAHTELAPLMADWMIRAGEEFWSACDMIIPVPLHRIRFWQRGYNQSAELARHVAAKTGIFFFPQGLMRQKRTCQQVGLSVRARQLNVHAAFRVPVKIRSQLDGKHIVLIDDVFTTGATVRSCAKTLCAAGVMRVDVVTFSRTLP